jgi:DNA-binding protein Fis
MKLTIEQTVTFNVRGHEIITDPLGPNFQETLEFVSQLSGIDMTDMYEIVRSQAKQDLQQIFDEIKGD